jgi:hypothetical protein
MTFAELIGTSRPASAKHTYATALLIASLKRGSLWMHRHRLRSERQPAKNAISRLLELPQLDSSRLEPATESER